MWIANTKDGKKPEYYQQVKVCVKKTSGYIETIEDEAIYVAQSDTWFAVNRLNMFQIGYEILGWYESEEVVPKSPWE